MLFMRQTMTAYLNYACFILFQVVLGWGRTMFRDPATTKDEECVPGKRKDGADLISKWRRHKLKRRAIHAFVWNKESLRAQNLAKIDYLLGKLIGF
jgi:hypothetical protein